MSAHEAGHAVVGTAVGCLIPGSSRPEQLSIVARSGGALGFTYIPPGEEDRKLMFSDELRGRLVTLMGGRAAEIVACGRVSTGALDDIQRATDLAYKSVAEYGLSPSIGPMSVGTLSAGGQEDAMFGSGMAAATAIVQSLRPGQRLVAPTVMYWSLRAWMVDFCNDWGIELVFYDADDATDLARVVVRGVRYIQSRIYQSRIYTSPYETDTFGFYNLRT